MLSGLLPLRRRFYLLLALLLGGALGANMLSASPALAASVSVSPSSGTVGSLVNIDGSGFMAGDTYEIYFADGSSHEINRDGTVAGDGTLSHSLRVPEMPGGDYTVTVEDSVDSDSDTFTVEPEMALSRSTAKVGYTVIVEGVGFRANRTVAIRFDGDTVERTATDSDGSFRDTFTVPEADRGNHSVSADDGIYDLDENLFIEQSIVIDPTSGTTGSEVEVRGYGFRDDRTITIEFDGERIDTSPATVRSDDNGSFRATFNVPTCFNRTVDVEASDGTYRADEEFTVLAAISLSDVSGLVGEEITIRGTGFGHSRRLDITFGGDELAIRPTNIRTDSTGCFTAEFNVPEKPNGEHRIIADDGFDTAQADFDILADMVISTSSGRIGDTVSISGTGFRANRTITVRFNGEHVDTNATDNNGSFTGSFLVPTYQSGNYTVTATDGASSLSATFTITISFDVDPIEGRVGTVVTLSGTGFTGPVAVRYDDQVVAMVTADNDGNFDTSFSVPPSMHGHHTITASDRVNTVEAVFTMESTPPPTPSLLEPEDGSRQGSQPMLDWQTVTDPSGVYYHLQIATDSSFSNLVLEKNGLSESSYALVTSEELQATGSDAPYYWRVRAIDRASNMSDWSQTLTFFVWTFPLWGLLLIVIAGSVAIAVGISRRVWRKA